jgi:hypothetical protein
VPQTVNRTTVDLEKTLHRASILVFLIYREYIVSLHVKKQEKLIPDELFEFHFIFLQNMKGEILTYEK